MKMRNLIVPGKTSRVVLMILMAAASISAQGPRGTVPRESADKYQAHAVQDGNSVGATLLKPSQAKKAFSSDLNHCCIAIEVALFPKADGMLTVSLNDFALRESGKDIGMKPSSPEVVAGKVYHNAQPDHPSEKGGRHVTIYPTTGIGYETGGGFDPVTGRRRGGVVTSAGVGVGIGSERPPVPTSNDADRRTMELELQEKGVPEGNTSSPVAGYLYFSMPEKSKGSYELVYMAGDKKVVLPLK